MYVGGEIADLARIARPAIGIVTAVQAVHLSRIGSLDAIEAAKGELVEALPPDGTAILNADDPIVRRMGARTVARVADLRVRRRCGCRGRRGRGARPRRDAVRPARPFGDRRAGGHPGARSPVRPQRAGGRRDGLRRRADARGDRRRARRRLVGAAPGRAGPSRRRDGHRRQLQRLAGLDVRRARAAGATCPGRRVAVLGEMLELGDEHDDGHHAVGEAAGRVADLVIVVGSGRGRPRRGRPRRRPRARSGPGGRRRRPRRSRPCVPAFGTATSSSSRPRGASGSTRSSMRCAPTRLEAPPR